MRYTFKCKECGFVFSEQLKIKDYTEKMELQTIKCPECGTNNVIRQYAPIGIHYKSAGFYSID
jgi:putative FmdB family regulatory protein